MTHQSLLRVATAGSVDDGKSTLIGRLLYESKSLALDQLAAVAQASAKRGFSQAGALDLSLLTDGLIAEREQGITIDVAYRYFATGKRQFILADSPGHEQYTRNMVTAASTADVAIVLVDAGKGVLPQTRRHALIAALLHVPHVIVAVNKMDLIDYDQTRFAQIEAEVRTFLAGVNHAGSLTVIPVAALLGDNIVTASPRMPWHPGAALLPLLEKLEPPKPKASGNDSAFRFAVQRVVRPSVAVDRAANHRRGYQGVVSGGTVTVGDLIVVQPAGLPARVARILAWDAINAVEISHGRASSGTAVTLELDAQLDVSRGCIISSAAKPPESARQLDANLCWMDEAPANLKNSYLMKLGTCTVPVAFAAVQGIYDLTSGQLGTTTGTSGGKGGSESSGTAIAMNTIARVSLKARQAVAFDTYAARPATGAFVLIDEFTNRTVASGTVV